MCRQAGRIVVRCVVSCLCVVGEIELSRFQVGSHHAPKIDVSFPGTTRCRFVISKERRITVILDQVQHASRA